MPEAARRREVGRGERVVPGVWRLRLPLPWPGVPHGNAWALAAGDGIVLVDTGYHDEGSLAHLERALAQVGLRLDLVRLLVCTHAHSDHYGQAAPILERAGCELWMHSDYAHAVSTADDPDTALARRLEVARQSGVPEEPLREWGERRRGMSSGIAGIVAPDRTLHEGDEVQTDLGTWHVLETPGHAPSHVCLVQPERRILISGDHVLGRISLYYDYGWTPDPAGEFLSSLAKVDRLGARLGLSGHGKPFTDVAGHIRGNVELVTSRLESALGALADGPKTAFEVMPALHAEAASAATAGWWLPETLCYLTHLEHTGRVRRHKGDPELWEAI